MSCVTWALWRRWLGGWLNYRRPYIVSVMFLLLLPAVAQGWLAYGIWCGVASLFFLPGHKFKKWTIVLRYPIIGGVYPLLERLWPISWVCGQFVDGYTSVAELTLGAFFGGVFAFYLTL